MSKQINKESMLPVGTVLSGRYRIDRYLSSGGFGNTYVATDMKFDSVVAVKEFFINSVTHREHDQITVSVSNSGNGQLFSQQLEKFRKEALRIHHLRNPHIVGVHDLFDENGTSYYVMDYIDGESLSERMKRTGRAFSESDVRSFLPQILDALNTVHSSGLFHLDLKPGNIMVDREGNIRLIDFGASKQEDSKGGGAKTSSLVCYTEGYAPVEQTDQNMKKFGPWTDIYALGATLYALLTNTHPPKPTDIDDDSTPDKREALPFPVGVSDEMRKLILWMMSYRRLDRPQNIQEIINTLGAEVAVPVNNGQTQVLEKPGQRGTGINPLYDEPISRPPKPDNNLLWPILTTFFCCMPFGIASIMSASKVDGLYSRGEYEAAQAASEEAKKYSKWAAIAGGVFLVIMFLVGFVQECSRDSRIPVEAVAEEYYVDTVLTAADTATALAEIGAATVEEADADLFQSTLDAILAAKFEAAESAMTEDTAVVIEDPVW